MTAPEPAAVLVVGGGLAGLRTVQELRARGYRGRLTMLAAEPRPPYDRPPLSKQVLSTPLDAPPPDTTLDADFDALGVDLRLGEAATGLEIDSPGSAAGPVSPRGTVRTARDGYRFDRLVVATGAAPVLLPGSPRQRVLRTRDDAATLHRLLRPGLRLAVVGAGWIGAELATAAAARGCVVTVVEASTAPLAAAVGAEVGGWTASWYADAGVELRTGRPVEAVTEDGLLLAGGEHLRADEVVTAVGVRPCVDWLADTPIRVDDGVVVDERLRTSVPGVYAVGDCASLWSLRFRRRIRFEHWDVAMHAPTVVAAGILGGDDVYDPVPYVWSEQFGRYLQYAGHHPVADRFVWRGEPGARRWAVCWLAGDRLVAILTVDRPRDLVQARRVIATGDPVDAVSLADPRVPIRDATVRR